MTLYCTDCGEPSSLNPCTECRRVEDEKQTQTTDEEDWAYEAYEDWLLQGDDDDDYGWV